MAMAVPSSVVLFAMAAAAALYPVLAAGGQPQSQQHVYYVDPAATDDSGSLLLLRTLKAAQVTVRSLLAERDGDVDVVVQLAPGRHVVSGGPLSFGPEDTPRQGRTVTWRSADPSNPAIVDGGTPLTGWAPSAHVKGALVAPLPASVPRGVILRQLWVNGRRAQRPVQYAVNLDGRSPGGLNATAGLPSTPCCPSPCRNKEPPYYPCPSCNCSVVNTSSGYDFSQSPVDPSLWRNPTDVEFIFHFPGQWTPWIESRCAVAAVHGAMVTVTQPCWGDLAERNFGPSKKQMRSLPPPAWAENVLENLTAAGSFYHDRLNNTITYLPRAGEEAATIAAFTSSEETLVLINGTRNHRWEGLIFQHATWGQVNTDRGFVDWQGGYSGGYGTPPHYEDCRDGRSCAAYADANGCGSTTKPAPHCEINRGLSPPGNVRVLTGYNLSFVSNVFRHLGGICE
jgi:hypothetical protein